MITQAAVEGFDEAARAALMAGPIRCEPQAQARCQSQAITFKRSKSRVQRAAEKATWDSVTRVRDSALSPQQQGNQSQSILMTQAQLNQVIAAFKNACLHDQAYQQQMAAALLHQMKAKKFPDHCRCAAQRLPRHTKLLKGKPRPLPPGTLDLQSVRHLYRMRSRSG